MPKKEPEWRDLAQAELKALCKHPREDEFMGTILDAEEGESFDAQWDRMTQALTPEGERLLRCERPATVS